MHNLLNKGFTEGPVFRQVAIFPLPCHSSSSFILHLRQPHQNDQIWDIWIAVVFCPLTFSPWPWACVFYKLNCFHRKSLAKNKEKRKKKKKKKKTVFMRRYRYQGRPFFFFFLIFLGYQDTFRVVNLRLCPRRLATTPSN